MSAIGRQAPHKAVMPDFIPRRRRFTLRLSVTFNLGCRTGLEAVKYLSLNGCCHAMVTINYCVLSVASRDASMIGDVMSRAG